MTDTIQTIIIVGTTSTAVTSIKVAVCNVGFIITDTIFDQFKWTRTV